MIKKKILHLAAIFLFAISTGITEVQAETKAESEFLEAVEQNMLIGEDFKEFEKGVQEVINAYYNPKTIIKKESFRPYEKEVIVKIKFSEKGIILEKELLKCSDTKLKRGVVEFFNKVSRFPRAPFEEDYFAIFLFQPKIKEIKKEGISNIETKTARKTAKTEAKKGVQTLFVSMDEEDTDNFFEKREKLISSVLKNSQLTIAQEKAPKECKQKENKTKTDETAKINKENAPQRQFELGEKMSSNVSIREYFQIMKLHREIMKKRR